MFDRMVLRLRGCVHLRSCCSHDSCCVAWQFGFIFSVAGYSSKVALLFECLCQAVFSFSVKHSAFQIMKVRSAVHVPIVLWHVVLPCSRLFLCISSCCSHSLYSVAIAAAVASTCGNQERMLRSLNNKLLDPGCLAR